MDSEVGSVSSDSDDVHRPRTLRQGLSAVKETVGQSIFGRGCLQEVWLIGGTQCFATEEGGGTENEGERTFHGDG
jgi:hypothetical protein